MTMQGSREQAIVKANLNAGNDLGLGELIAAYDIVYRRFYSEDATKFYSIDPEYSIRKISDLRPSIQRFIIKNHSLDPESAEFLAKYADLMRRQGLPFVFSVPHLIEYIGSTNNKVLHITKNKNLHYHTTKIPKKSGGFRTIDAPSDALKSIQSSINKKILQHVRLSKAATGFRAKKSIVDNAVLHQKKYAVYGLDLENFFHSIQENRVLAALVNLGFPRSVARVMTNLCCFNGRLPMGAPSSPAIANIVASRLDRRLIQLAKKEGAAYTRYADDITFSFVNKSSLRIIPLIKEIIQSEGFKLNENKEELNFRHQRQYVTGIVVNDHLNVPKPDYKKLRATIFNVKTKGIAREMEKWGAKTPVEFRAQLNGHINFISMVNSAKASKLSEDFNEINWNL